MLTIAAGVVLGLLAFPVVCWCLMAAFTLCIELPLAFLSVAWDASRDGFRRALEHLGRHLHPHSRSTSLLVVALVLATTIIFAAIALSLVAVVIYR